MKHPLLPYCIVGLLLISGTVVQGQEQLLRKMIKSKPLQSKSSAPNAKLKKSVSIAADGSTPTITGFDPAVGGKGAIITITGTNFNNGTTVTIGGVIMNKFHVISGTSIEVQLEDEVNGKIAVTGNGVTATSTTDLKYIPKPVISEISNKNFATGDKITITGENFTDETEIWIDGVAQTITVNSETEIELTVSGPANKGLIELKTVGGQTTYGGNAPFDAAANITLPLQGQGINIIPTPTFNFTQVHDGSNFAFRLGIWGNTLGTDSSLKKVVNNLLVPQISLFGFKADGLLRLNPLEQKWGIAASFQLNVLLKKVSYYDTSSKDISSFNPFVLHPKLGFTANFFDNYVFIGGYLNMFSVVTENEEFKNFFGSKKSTFVYPNFNLGGIFDFEGGKQSIKVELDLVIHNGETRMLLPTRDKVIPYLKVALLSDL